MSLIYFIQVGADGPIKIGVSQNPASRLASLQGGHHEQLRLIGFTPGTHQDEQRLHATLASFHLAREWFAPAPEVLAEIRENLGRFHELIEEAGAARDALNEGIGELRLSNIPAGLARFRVAADLLNTLLAYENDNAPAAPPPGSAAEALTEGA